LLRSVSENLALKLIALVLSVGIWFYASSERNPVTTKKVKAEIVVVGSAPSDLIVKIRQEPLPIEVSGPRLEVDGIMDGDVKAIVNLSSSRPETKEIRVDSFKLSASTPNVLVLSPGQSVPAEITAKQRRRIPIEAIYNKENPLGRVYGSVKLDPNWAWAVGSRVDVQRVAKLQVFIETRGGNVREDLPIYAVDKSDVQLDDIQTEPRKTHVELNLVEAPTTRTLIVSCQLIGRPALPYKVADVIIKPDQVTVSGKPEALLQLTNISTANVNVEGIMGEIVREVPLRLPQDVTIKDGPKRVTVTIRVRDASRPSP